VTEETVGHYLYYARTYRMVRTPEGRRGYVLNLSTGAMWDEEFARVKAGEPGQNTCTAKVFGAVEQ
jgi:hypothetical protein